MDIKTLISQPIAKELAAFNKAFSHSLESDSVKMQIVADYVMQSNGKKLRPVVLLLSALLSGKVTDISIESAVLIELLHTASLLHDDVVDDAKERRGRPSVNAVFDNKVAVLSGDYILSVSLQKALKIGDFRILSVFVQLGKYLSLGELNQLHNVQELIVSEPSYLRVIKEKTATLFSACTEIGALSSESASDEQIEALRSYGECIGMCFQIRDDIFDYYDNAIVGKPTGNDIREGKVTLPLLYALNQASGDEKSHIMTILQSQDFSDVNIKYLINYAKEHGGIDYSREKMQHYADLAKGYLNIFPDCEAKDALVRLAEYIMVRRY